MNVYEATKHQKFGWIKEGKAAPTTDENECEE